jgi:pimeloyl-ACP methyl ester carboxylesterase
MLGMIAYDATEALARINVPTLVVVGDQDTTTTPEAGAFIVKHVPEAKLVMLTPARHMGLLEHHERFDQVVADPQTRALGMIQRRAGSELGLVGLPLYYAAQLVLAYTV